MKKLLDDRLTEAYDRLMLTYALRQALRISVIGFILAIVSLLIMGKPGEAMPAFVSIPVYMGFLGAGMAWTASASAA